MRRGIWAMFGALAVMLVLAVVIETAEAGSAGHTLHGRYEQHREEPSEEALGVCSVCGGKASLCTHLPIIAIETGGQKIPGYPITGEDGHLIAYETTEDGAEEIRVRYHTSAESGTWHHVDDPATESGEAMFRIRGNSSRYFSKSSYRLMLVEPSGEVRRQDTMLGMDAGTEWALHGPFLDKTLIRNYMWMNLAGKIMDWAPDVRFCELVLDGEYRGVYVMMEMIDVDRNRLPLAKYRNGDVMFSYLARIEPHANEDKLLDNFLDYTFRLESGRAVELVYPGTRYRTEAVKDYVSEDLSSIERALFSTELANGDTSYKNLIDMDSFVDYYILEEFLAINDMFSASTYFYKDARGKLTMGPVWDFNNALDNFFAPMPQEALFLAQRGWFGQLMKSPDFVEVVIRRYRELRQTVLSEENLRQYVEETEAWLGSAVLRNDAVWGFSYDPDQLTPQERRRPEIGTDRDLADMNPSSHAEAVDRMVEYMTERGRWMDAHIETLRQYCHASKNR